MSAANEIIDYICTGMGLCLKCCKDFAPGSLIVQIALLLIGSGLSIFDTITDWNIVIQFRDQGFQNPLLPIDVNWLHAWYLFAVIGTILTTITVFHETLNVLHSLWHTCKRCCCKSGKCYKVLQGKQEDMEMPSKTEDNNTTQGKPTTHNQEDGSKGNRDHHDHQYHLYQDGSNENIRGKDKNKKDTNDDNDHTENGTNTNPQNKGTDSEDDEETINDACKCCYRFGWNFTTRAETLSFLSLWFHDVPMLTMAVLYAFAQSTCKLPEREDISGDLLSIGISATASTVAVSYRLTRSFIRLCISVGVRIKSKKEASRMGKWGKRCSRFLPEKGDVIYPKDTCAELCIIPYFASLLFDLFLVSAGASIAFSIWRNYIILKHDTNFDDSLGIYRFQTDGSYMFLTNISGTIIPSTGRNSNGSYVVLETITPNDLRVSRVYCLSEFQYLKKDSEIVFNTIELEPLSDKGVFCAVKSGFNSRDFENFSTCTLYYGGLGSKILHYGFSDPTTGETKLLENECIVLKDRLPPVDAGPDFDRSIDLKTNVQYADIGSSEELLMFYIHTETLITLFNVSIREIVAARLDTTVIHTFQNPVTGNETTYLIRFLYSYSSTQLTYGVREIVRSPSGNLSCIYRSPSDQIGIFFYGYFDNQVGDYQIVLKCSTISPIYLIPRGRSFLTIDCPYY